MINDEIREITRRFVEALHPEKIILFGSYARDEEREDSDYDFFIVMPDGTRDMVSATQKAYKSLRSMGKRRSVDVLMNTSSLFKTRSTMITMENIVTKEGKLLYG